MIWKKFYNIFFSTLRRQLITGVAVVHAVMMTFFIVDLVHRQQVLIFERQTEHATALANTLATSAAGWLASDDISGLQELADEQRRYPELEYAMLLNERGQVLAHTDSSRLGLYVLDLPDQIVETVLNQNAELVDVIVPSKLAGRHVGWARVGIGQRLSEQRLTEITRNGILYAIVAIIIGSLLAFFMGKRITMRLYDIQSVMDDVRLGNQKARSHLTGIDEAAGMSNNFNMMLDMLEKRDHEIRLSEYKYRSLIQTIQAAIVVHGSQTEVITSNSFAQNLLGLSEDQMKGKEVIDPAWSFIREDGSVMPVEEYPVSMVISTGSSIRDYIVGVNRPDLGTIVWALVNADPEFDDEGKLFQVLVSFVDITERKNTEEMLDMERNRMEIILSSLKTGLSLINPDMTISWVNKKILEMFPVGEPVGRLCHVFFENRETICEGCGTMQAFLSGKVFESMQFVPSTGKWYNIISQPVKDEAGRVVNVLEGITDITERKQIEESLRESEYKLGEAVRITHVGYWDRDLLRQTITLSEEACRIFGLPADFHTPSLNEWHIQWLKLIHPDDQERAAKAAADALSDGPSYNIEYRVILSDGTLRYVHSFAELTKDKLGKPIRMFGIMMDITERKRSEEEIHKLNEELEERVIERTGDLNRKSTELSESQMALMNIVEDMNMKTLELEQANIKLQELDRLKSMFIASMSHELRTPLNSIIGFSSIMLNEWVGKMNSEQKENLSTILRSGKHLLSLINDVIDVSKIESGNIETYPDNIDLYDVMQEAAGSFANDIQKKGLDLQINLIHQIIRADRRRLLQCVLNLISNAVKYTEKGMICVTAELLHEEDAVKISVSDTGIGMRQEDMLNLFSAFIRFDSPLRSTIPGTGLGLYLTKKITREILKGDISASSIYEKGSLFTLKIPVK